LHITIDGCFGGIQTGTSCQDRDGPFTGESKKQFQFHFPEGSAERGWVCSVFADLVGREKQDGEGRG